MPGSGAQVPDQFRTPRAGNQGVTRWHAMHIAIERAGAVPDLDRKVVGDHFRVRFAGHARVRHDLRQIGRACEHARRREIVQVAHAHVVARADGAALPLVPTDEGEVAEQVTGRVLPPVSKSLERDSCVRGVRGDPQQT